MRLDLTLGTQITCTDQSSGKLVEIVVDPTTKQVTDLVVQKGLLTKQAWVLPLTAVERVTGHAIQLNLHSDELNTYPEYHTTDLSEPAAGGPQTAGASLSPALGLSAEPPTPTVRKRLREGIVTGRTVISTKTAVRTQQGDVGSLDRVLIDAESGQIAQLVIRKGFFSKKFLIPHEVIAQISADAILLTLRSEEIAALPQVESRRDDEVLAEIQQRLQEGWPAFTGVMATCEAGSIHLVGYVRSSAVEIAQQQPNVTAVDNRLAITKVGTAPKLNYG